MKSIIALNGSAGSFEGVDLYHMLNKIFMNVVMGIIFGKKNNGGKVGEGI